jgi:phospho-N-acetylmuramoyl-pentapeptide-transferase
MVLAALTSLLVTLWMGPKVIKTLYELKTGQSIRVEDCPLLVELHQKKKDTPTMGGILILFSMLVSLFLWMDWTSSFTFILLLTTLVLGFVGGYDDFLKVKFKNSKGMRGRSKFFLQNGLALFIVLYLLCPPFAEWFQCGSWFKPPFGKDLAGTELPLQQLMGTYFIPFFKNPVVQAGGVGLILSGLFSMFVIAGSSNAVNLTDGLDGLAAGCVVLVASVLGLIAFLSNNLEICRYLNLVYIEGSGEVGVCLFALVGACLGFLWYNGYPAQIFMGDVGSIAMGGILGVSAILLRRELLFAIAGGVFVAETLSVILQVASYKWRNKKRIFLCSPLHHHFEYKGWPETKVVLRFWIVGLVLALFAIVSLKFQ